MTRPLTNGRRGALNKSSADSTSAGSNPALAPAQQHSLIVPGRYHNTHLPGLGVSCWVNTIMKFPNKNLNKTFPAVTSTRSLQAAVTCCDTGAGVMLCPLLENDGRRAPLLCASCQRHVPARDRQPSLASLTGRCSLAPMTFTIKENF